MNSLSIKKTLIRCPVLQHLIWVYTVCKAYLSQYLGLLQYFTALPFTLCRGFFYPQNLSCTPKIEENLNVLLYICLGYKNRKTEQIYPHFQNAVKTLFISEVPLKSTHRIHVFLFVSDDKLKWILLFFQRKYSRLSLSRIPWDCLKYFEISVLRHIRFAELGKTNSINHI